MFQGPYLRKYAAEATINFCLANPNGEELKTDAAHAAADTKIMKDEGAEANTTNGFTDEGTGYSIVLTATEMTAARVVVYVVDQGAKAWRDTALVIETYGHASAQHAFDFDTASVAQSGDNYTFVPAIYTDTNELQTDWTDGGRLDLLIDAIKAVTDNLPDSGALNDLATILADTNELQTDWTNGGRLDLLIDAIKAITDLLTLAAIADAAWDEVMDANAPGACNTAREYMNVLIAAAAGKTAGTGDWSARDLGDTKTRLQGTLSTAGARSSIDTLDGT